MEREQSEQDGERDGRACLRLFKFVLPKNKRISRIEFKNLTNGKVFYSKFFLIKTFIVPKNQLRFAVSVSKKVASKAVDRNRLRRYGYTSLQSLWTNLQDGNFGHIMAQKGASKLSFDEVRSEIETLLTKAHLLKRK